MRYALWACLPVTMVRQRLYGYIRLIPWSIRCRQDISQGTTLLHQRGILVKDVIRPRNMRLFPDDCIPLSLFSSISWKCFFFSRTSDISGFHWRHQYTPGIDVITLLPVRGPLTRYVNLCVAHTLVCRGRFSCHRRQRKPLVSDSGKDHGTCVTHVGMHVGIANPRLWGKRSRHSRRMRNPPFYVYGKRPMP